MQTPVVVEVAGSFFEAGLVEIAGDDDGIAAGPTTYATRVPSGDTCTSSTERSLNTSLL
jgi:hypothetical protein